MINEMETISITYRGIVHKLTEYEKLVDTIEMIYTMCDQKITHWGDSITGKNGGKVKKYKRGKILYNSLKNDNLERVSFFLTGRFCNSSIRLYYIYFYKLQGEVYNGGI